MGVLSLNGTLELWHLMGLAALYGGGTAFFGPAFDAMPFPPIGSPGGATGAGVGTGTLTFSDANDGTFAYTVNGISQTKAITRQTFGPLPLCTFGAQVNLALTNNYQDLWWAAPAGSRCKGPARQGTRRGLQCPHRRRREQRTATRMVPAATPRPSPSVRPRPGSRCGRRAQG